MNPLTERYPDLLGDQDDPALLACLADLDATRAVFTLPPECDAAIARVLIADAPLPVRPTARPLLHRLTSLPWPAQRWRLAPLLMAVLLVGSGLGVYLHGAGSTPVSAQTVLQRAAAVRPGPNQATHAVYRLTASGGITGTAEVWVGTDAQGAPSEYALTVTAAKNGQPDPELSSQSVLTGQTLKEYDPVSNTVTVSSQGDSDHGLRERFVGALAAQKVSRMLADQHQTAAPAPQQTLDGVSVYVVSVQGADETFYFNAQSYILEGADWTQDGRVSQARLDPASYQTMALSAVPPQAFTLTAPATARVVTPSPSAAPAKKVGVVKVEDDRIITAAAAACHTTISAFNAALQAGTKSMLAICQETAPTMTAQQLVTALLVPLKASLDAQVASGALTRSQEADQLAGAQRKLLYMVTAQPGNTPIEVPGPSVKQP
jgi:hypothetical protein